MIPMRPTFSPSPVIGHRSLLVSAAAVTLVFSATAHAQRYILRDNTALQAADVTLGSGALIQQVALPGGGSFERRYPLGDVVRLDFPEPEALEEAQKLVVAGKGSEALALVEPVYRQFAPFARVPGSHWPRAAQLRLEALLLGVDALTITSAARELMTSGLGPDVTGVAKLALAQLDARAGRESLANIMLEEIVREAPPAIQARAWLLRGDLAAARNSHAEALENYLRIPAFYGTIDEFMPAALLGAARAYKGFGDNGRAERSALELIDTYPETLQAATARREFKL
jgi:tetratricopeptide (TPR) repeat protein